MKVAIIGAGNMGGAIARGLLERTQTELTIIDPSNRSFAESGIKTLEKIDVTVAQCDCIIIAVKPWIAPLVIDELSALLTSVQSPRVSVCSIVAGLSCEELSKHFATQPVFRIMPNTAVGVGEGMTFISHERAQEDELESVEQIFTALGRVMIVDEKQMNACMALASCGIAYAMRYVRAAMEGGVELGVSALASQDIVVQTLRGAAALLSTGSHPEIEIDKVTTPGGITIKGLNAMEQCGFTNAVIQGLKASK